MATTVHRRALVVCRNCGLEDVLGGYGLCRACYQFWKRTGLPRPWVENAVLARIRAVKEGSRVRA